MPNLYKFNIGNDFVSKASSAIEDFIANREKETIKVALSGGSSPKAVYERLAESEKIDWRKVELYLVDERSDQSNAKMIEGTLTSKLSELKAFHKFDKNYEAKIKKLSRPFFDLVLLGLGKDGHTASLFPYGSELDEFEKLAIRAESPSGIKERLTLTFPAIMSSEKIIFLIRGAEKKDIVEKWLGDESSDKEIPAKAVLDHPDVDIYYDHSS